VLRTSAVVDERLAETDDKLERFERCMLPTTPHNAPSTPASPQSGTLPAGAAAETGKVARTAEVWRKDRDLPIEFETLPNTRGRFASTAASLLDSARKNYPCRRR